MNIDELDEQIDTSVRYQGSDMIRLDDTSGSIDALRTGSTTADTFLPVMASNTNTVRKSVRIIEPNNNSKQLSKQQGKRFPVLDCGLYVLTDSRAKTGP